MELSFNATREDPGESIALNSSAWAGSIYEFAYKCGHSTRGFENPSVLCYRNAAILLFLHTPIFLNWIDDTYCPRQTHICDPTLRFACALKTLSYQYWIDDRADKNHERPMELVWKILLTTSWERNPHEQEDVAEFMTSFMSLLFDTDLIELHKLFLIESNRCKVCAKCSKSTKLERTSAQFLSARFLGDEHSSSTIEDAITRGMVSHLDDNCEYCKTPCVYIHESIVDPPEILLVHVNRHDVLKKLKNRLLLKDKLVIPDKLREDEGVQRKEELGYELYAIIFHWGEDTKGGHYVIAVKDPGGKWVLVNNEKVDPRPLEDILDEKSNIGDEAIGDAYVLAYRRLPSVANISLPPSDSGKDNVTEDVKLEGTIRLEERNIQWTVQQQLVLPPGAGGLIQLRPRAKVQYAKLQLTLTSEATGEILEGEVRISLKPRDIQQSGRQTSNTETKKRATRRSTRITRQAAKEPTAKAANPQGVTKRASNKTSTKSTQKLGWE